MAKKENTTDQVLIEIVTELGEKLENKVEIADIKALIAAQIDGKKITLDNIAEDLKIFIEKHRRIQISVPAMNLIVDVDNDTLKTYPKMFKYLDDVVAGNNIFFVGEAGSGKAQPLYSKILTENGWVTFEDIKVGDKIFGQDGVLYETDKVFDRGAKSVYRVFMNDGGHTDTCDEHLWKIYTRNDRHRSGVGRVLQLKDFVKSIVTNNGIANAFIDVAEAVPFAKVEHIIHPYILGVILGYGSLSQNQISISNPEKEVMDMVESLLHEDVELHRLKSSGGRCDRYSIVSKNDRENIYRTELVRMGLMYKKSITKHIPEEYLFDSIGNRQELIRGLNDTDGYCSETSFEYSTSSEALMNDYEELARSLGFTAKHSSRIPKFKDADGNMKNGELSYRIYVNFRGEFIPFHLKRKADKYHIPLKYTGCRYIKSVSYLGEMETRCISTTNPEHLYITDDYIVTHNTHISELIAQTLGIETQFINCSQYTSPIDIIGGQTIEGYKDGKLIDAVRRGCILILDEMPKLDSNTAGLLNDALARTSKDMTPENRRFVRTARPSDPPVPINPKFAVIATGNIYPNKEDVLKYVGNNKQDLSLLDRFSGSVYRIDYDENLDQKISMLQYIYELCVKNKGKAIREVLADKGYTNYAVMSIRTIGAFRSALKMEAQSIYVGNTGRNGKVLWDAVDSYLTCFPDDVRKTIMDITGITKKGIDDMATLLCNEIVKSVRGGNILPKNLTCEFYIEGLKGTDFINKD